MVPARRSEKVSAHAVAMPTTQSHANTRQAGEVTMRGPAGLNRAEPGQALTRSPQRRSRCDITVGGGDRDNGENVSRS